MTASSETLPANSASTKEDAELKKLNTSIKADGVAISLLVSAAMLFSFALIRSTDMHTMAIFFVSMMLMIFNSIMFLTNMIASIVKYQLLAHEQRLAKSSARVESH